MKFYDNYRRIVAIIEKSAGNETVGDMWLETRSFPKETPIEEILKWAKSKNCGGKLIITIDEDK